MFLKNFWSWGVAAQFFGLKDRWKFYTKAWDFAREDDLPPQSVLGGSYRIAGGLHLNFGVHDVLNKNNEQRDYFLGLKLEFREDDPKYFGGWGCDRCSF